VPFDQTDTICNIKYISPTGEGDGTNPSFPTTLTNALNDINETCTSLLMMATGNYQFDETLSLPSNVILDGGYIGNETWIKSSSDLTILTISPPLAFANVSVNGTTYQVSHYIGNIT
jgi:hypothetical protein